MRFLLLAVVLISWAHPLLFAQTHPIEINADTTNRQIILPEVEVISRQSPLALDSIPGTITLKTKYLNRLPQFMGYADPLRTLQLMPGVATTGEVSSGMYVRGSDPSQNLVLFDGVPLYNAMHLIGFFSVFNSDHLSSVQLDKSYISPQYGGRTAGVLSVWSNNRIPAKQQFTANVNLLSANATWSIPISKKMAVTASARYSYINTILSLTSKMLNTENAMRYGFNDYNFTWIYRPNDHHFFSINSYCGKDEAEILETQYKATGSVNWRNAMAAANWQYTNRQFSCNTTAFLSYYADEISVFAGNDNLRLLSQIKDYGLRTTAKGTNYRINWTVGGEYINHTSHPQSVQMDGIFNEENQFDPVVNTHELALFVELNKQWLQRISLSAGLRMSALYYDPTQSIVAYTQSNANKSYGGLEPRLAVNYRISHQSALTASYNRQFQYMNQVIVSGTGLPTNFWLPASGGIKPQHTHAFSLGYTQNWQQKMFDLTVELYYKSCNNQLESVGALNDLIGSSVDYSSRFAVGKGENYGLELMLRKNGGKWSGWISYTLGWAWRQFPTIESNRRLPAQSDRRHDLAISSTYALSSRWDLSANFILASGTPFTAPKGIYIIGDWSVCEYLPRSSTRMPIYHRIDLSATYNLRIKGLKNSKLNLSIYNAYGQNNPILFDTLLNYLPDEMKIKVFKRLRSLYSFMPSIGFSFQI